MLPRLAIRALVANAKDLKDLSRVGELDNGWQASKNNVSSSEPTRGIKELRLQLGKAAADLLVSVGVTHGARGTRVRLLGPQIEMRTRVRRRPIVNTADKLDIGWGRCTKVIQG